MENKIDTYICYGKQNEQSMINPYFHFGESNIWPRGFFIKDISTDYNAVYLLIQKNNRYIYNY